MITVIIFIMYSPTNRTAYNLWFNDDDDGTSNKNGKDDIPIVDVQ